jgi:hypothetical protein
MDKREQDRPERKKHGHGHDKDEREHRERQRGTGFGTERAVYLQFLARRWKGSDPPTPQAYSRALKQWRQLPGVIVTAPTDLGGIPTSTATPSMNRTSRRRRTE